jgi:hypothetical protein
MAVLIRPHDRVGDKPINELTEADGLDYAMTPALRRPPGALRSRMPYGLGKQ